MECVCGMPDMFKRVIKGRDERGSKAMMKYSKNNILIKGRTIFISFLNHGANQ